MARRWIHRGGCCLTGRCWRLRCRIEGALFVLDERARDRRLCHVRSVTCLLHVRHPRSADSVSRQPPDYGAAACCPGRSADNRTSAPSRSTRPSRSATAGQRPDRRVEHRPVDHRVRPRYVQKRQRVDLSEVFAQVDAHTLSGCPTAQRDVPTSEIARLGSELRPGASAGERPLSVGISFRDQNHDRLMAGFTRTSAAPVQARLRHLALNPARPRRRRRALRRGPKVRRSCWPGGGHLPAFRSAQHRRRLPPSRARSRQTESGVRP